MVASKVAVVTGASSGFGRKISIRLSQNGFRVFGASRNPKEIENMETLRIDVDSDDSVASGISTLLQKVDRVDVLVNCAGFVLTGAIEETSTDEAKSQFETNFFGTVRMVRAVLPIMRRQHGGHIINIGSVAALIPVPFEGFYAATKSALEGYTEALRHEVKSFGIKVSIIEPGFYKTNISAAAKAVSDNLESYKTMRENTRGKIIGEIKSGQDPEEVAKKVLWIVESNSPKLHYIVGRERWFVRLRKILPSSTFESAIRKHWSLDEQ